MKSSVFPSKLFLILWWGQREKLPCFAARFLGRNVDFLHVTQWPEFKYQYTNLKSSDVDTFRFHTQQTIGVNV